MAARPIPRQQWAPTAHLYFADEAGIVHVIKTGPEFEVVAENEMQETVMATPAIAGNRLLVRTVKQLVCIGQP